MSQRDKKIESKSHVSYTSPTLAFSPLWLWSFPFLLNVTTVANPALPVSGFVKTHRQLGPPQYAINALNAKSPQICPSFGSFYP
jgi:hypothetical protein